MSPKQPWYSLQICVYQCVCVCVCFLNVVSPPAERIFPPSHHSSLASSSLPRFWHAKAAHFIFLPPAERKCLFMASRLSPIKPSTQCPVFGLGLHFKQKSEAGLPAPLFLSFTLLLSSGSGRGIWEACCCFWNLPPSFSRTGDRKLTDWENV